MCICEGKRFHWMQLRVWTCSGRKIGIILLLKRWWHSREDWRGENNLWWFCVLLEDQTKSGIPTRRYISWILYRRCDSYNQEMGFLFARDNKRTAIIGDCDTMFRNLLKRGQNIHLELFTIGFFIGHLTLRKIPRRGETTDVKNNNVDTPAIKLIIRWRTR